MNREIAMNQNRGTSTPRHPQHDGGTDPSTLKRAPPDRNQKYSIDRHHPRPKRDKKRSGHRTWTHTPLPRDMRMLLRFQRPPRPTDQVFKLWRRTPDRCPMRADHCSASASALSSPTSDSRAWRHAAVTSGSMNIHTTPQPCGATPVPRRVRGCSGGTACRRSPVRTEVPAFENVSRNECVPSARDQSDVLLGPRCPRSVRRIRAASASPARSSVRA